MVCTTSSRTRSRVRPSSFKVTAATLFLGEQPQEDVLGPDEVVVEVLGFLLGQNERPAGPVGKAFEHTLSRSSLP